MILEGDVPPQRQLVALVLEKGLDLLGVQRGSPTADTTQRLTDPPSLIEHILQSPWARPQLLELGEPHCSLEPLLREIPWGWGELLPQAAPPAPTSCLQLRISIPSSPPLPAPAPWDGVSRSSCLGLSLSPPDAPLFSAPHTSHFQPTSPRNFKYSRLLSLLHGAAENHNHDSALLKKAGPQCLRGSVMLPAPPPSCLDPSPPFFLSSKSPPCRELGAGQGGGS